jgi:hypothetical protein
MNGSIRRRKMGVRFIKHLDSAGGEIFIKQSLSMLTNQIQPA